MHPSVPSPTATQLHIVMGRLTVCLPEGRTVLHCSVIMYRKTASQTSHDSSDSRWLVQRRMIGDKEVHPCGTSTQAAWDQHQRQPYDQ